MKLRFALIACLLFAGCCSKAHWKATPQYGGSEDRLLICDASGKVLEEIIHGAGPQATWDVCNMNCEYFETEEQAKAYAESLVWAHVDGK